MLEHLFRDVDGHVPDRLVRGLAALGEIGNERVAVVVPPAGHSRFLLNRSPNRFEAGPRSRRVGRLRLPEGKHVPLRPRLPELVQIPLGMRYERGQDVGVEGNRSAFPCLGLGLSRDHDGLVERRSRVRHSSWSQILTS